MLQPSVFHCLLFPWFLLFDIPGDRAGFRELIAIMNLFHAALPMGQKRVSIRETAAGQVIERLSVCLCRRENPQGQTPIATFVCEKGDDQARTHSSISVSQSVGAI